MSHFNEKHVLNISSEPLKFLDTQKWLFVVWAACRKKKIYFIFKILLSWMNYILQKLFGNTKHAHF
jgi:hypothetical protein